MASGRRRVWNITQGLRQEHSAIRTTTISPGVVESELAATITDTDTAAYLHEACKIALKPEAIAKAIRYAIEQPGEVVAPDGRGVLSVGLGPGG